MTDVGKAAKRAGHQHPSVIRRIDPEPPRATSSAKPHRKPRKPFGIAYESQLLRLVNGRLWRIWETRWRWFKTAGQRDQALADTLKKASKIERHHTKVDRLPDNQEGDA